MVIDSHDTQQTNNLITLVRQAMHQRGNSTIAYGNEEPDSSLLYPACAFSHLNYLLEVLVAPPGGVLEYKAFSKKF